jgi:hypothetical protein
VLLVMLMLGAEGGATAARSYHRFNRLRTNTSSLRDHPLNLRFVLWPVAAASLKEWRYRPRLEVEFIPDENGSAQKAHGMRATKAFRDLHKGSRTKYGEARR